MSDYIINSKASDIKHFESSLLWLDILTVIEDWAQGLRDIQNTSSDTIELFRTQGRVEALEYMKNIPKALYSQLINEDKEIEHD